MERIRKILENRWVFLSVIGVGLGLRLVVAGLGYNYDMRSWFIVSDIMWNGGSVYAETGRYNYGPVWFLIIHALDLAARHNHEVLRYLIAGFLSAVDLGIFYFLCRRAGAVAGALFFLNPISIMVSGYHCQFDNVAILLGLWSTWLLGDDFENPLNRRKLGGLLLLGLSLMTKHLFFAFPLWLAVKQKGLGQKAVVLLVPLACFCLAFAPFWAAGGPGIVGNVFQYRPAGTDCFYSFFVPMSIQRYLNSTGVWYLLLILFAFICRPRGGFESLLIYTGVLVAFSPVTANQYLAIPMALAAVQASVLFLAYTVAGAVHIGGDLEGPHLVPLTGSHWKDYAIYSLCGALAWMLWRQRFRQLFQAVGREVQFQLGWPK